ncbi:MAG: DUF6179 domain-containing protein [Syntrophomonas sp.]
MKCTDIEKQTTIKKQHLDPHQYTLSLIKEGYRVGLIDQQTLNSIQTQLMSLLRDLITRYTKGESTSVKAETAQSILLSILYSIDACISNTNNPVDAIALLKADNIIELYEKGLTVVSSCLAEAKSLYQEILNKKLNIPLKAYQATIDEALPEFFISYDVIFKAQDTMASIDYPLLFDDMRIKGIYYIKQYLKKLEIETEFCSLFAIEDIEKLLLNYGRVYDLDYREALINIFEVLLTNSIFSALSSNNPNKLSITKHQYEILLEKLKAVDHTLYSSLFNKAIEALLYELRIARPELKNYIRKFKSVLMPRFLNALDHDSLSNVIILDIEHYQFDNIFDEGKRMDNDSFRNLIEQIMECTNIIEKNQIINSSIHSLGDFIDVLEADCLFGDEFSALFNTLGDVELSILARIVLNEELRSYPLDLSLQSFIENPTDMQWKTEYARFLLTLSTDRLNAIEKYISSPWQADGSPSFIE